MDDIVKMVDEGNIIDAKNAVFKVMDGLRDDLMETATSFFNENVDLDEGGE